MARDVMLAAVENRFGNVAKAPAEIEWLTDNGSGYTADKTRAFASEIGLKPLTTPVCGPQSNGMAESFVKTTKRDYVVFMPKPDAATAAHNLAIAFEHYNEKHPHSARKYRSHASSGAGPIHQLKCEVVSGGTGANPPQAIPVPLDTSHAKSGRSVRSDDPFRQMKYSPLKPLLALRLIDT
jgi:hypothetical protein